MAIFNKLFREKTIDVLRLDIYMSISPVIEGGHGTACIKWVPLTHDEPNLRVLLICLLYAHIMTINKESRVKIFRLIDELSKANVRDEGNTGFAFKEWVVQLNSMTSQFAQQFIWPWKLVDNINELVKPGLFQAILRASVNEPREWYIDLKKVASGQDWIFVSSVVLIAIDAYCKGVYRLGCYELAVYLWQINEFYKSPENIRPRQESLALSHAINAVRSGNLTVP